ncbi:d-3-phosphoglycerate dehydrogenase [Anaeramoeba flamelloides]|uniref:D-3-phosphoglycerate dehydrogenase n=1 Tax=Anaeramoeba flamelloides TaxID=1746091 RepID=A0AAV8A5G2_9EUKA|nr:d-3-phosphoglycerate dehydrogenase [Anaeramoeba flamelloides]KAJ6243553.1 d-3-phosphoglycerate dehydrogenase [Anaeramoeba flamelloides]|eukprot:Anaeramoba_flamelloidesa84921_1336.p1 GENE.a84921_1336~~a84921_1336.p1  ORF type:complete len:323 (-),score=91.66 a84921_1336:283-1251(-)
MTKFFIADKVDPFVVKTFGEIGEVINNPGATAEKLPELIGDSNFLVVRSTRVTEETIKAATKLKVIIRAGAGVDTINIEAATKNGIFVCNCPGTNSHAVVELVIGHMICADRELFSTTTILKDGKWCKKQFTKSRGLFGRKLGIVGLGYIGRLVAKAAKGLGMVVAAYDKYVPKEAMDKLEVEWIESVDKLCEVSDVMTLHTVLTEETKHMFNLEMFRKCKDGMIFINASRGGVVDQSCIPQIVKEKGIKFALDVYEDEPSVNDEEFPHTELAKALTSMTPHIGASTLQAAEAVGLMTVDIAKYFLENEKPPKLNVVNKTLL